MGALAYDLPEPLTPRIEEEIQRLQPVDYRVAALVLVPATHEESGGYRIVFSTRQFSDLTGFDGEELVGRIMDWFEGPDTDPDALGDLYASIEAAEHAEVDLLLYTKAGVSFWARLQLQPIERRDGTVDGFAVYVSHSEKSRASYLSDIWQKIEDTWTGASKEG